MSIAFKVYVCCAGCLKVYGSRLVPPSAEDAPGDIEALLESNFLREQQFRCQDCDSCIATVTGVKQLEDDALVRTLELCF